MTAIETFGFGQYRLQPAGVNGNRDRDLMLAREWTDADPHHAGRTAPEFWLEQRLGRDSYLLSDRRGPLFFFKMHAWYKMPEDVPIKEGTAPAAEVVRLPANGMDRVVEIYIQFPPANGEVRRLTSGLTEGMVWLERVLVQSKVREVFFVSSNESLIAFCVRRLGFLHHGDKLRKTLIAEAATANAVERKA